LSVLLVLLELLSLPSSSLLSLLLLPLSPLLLPLRLTSPTTLTSTATISGGSPAWESVMIFSSFVC
jgi:hypothetical protein